MTAFLTSAYGEDEEMRELFTPFVPLVEKMAKQISETLQEFHRSASAFEATISKLERFHKQCDREQQEVKDEMKRVDKELEDLSIANTIKKLNLAFTNSTPS